MGRSEWTHRSERIAREGPGWQVARLDRLYFCLFVALSVSRPAGSVAQLVEQRTENPCVGGSIPPRATILTAFYRTAAWGSF